MATETSSIDELLMGHATPSHPQTPEHKEEEYEEVESNEADVHEVDVAQDSYEQDRQDAQEHEEENAEEDEKPRPQEEIDDYGNKKPVDNEVIRERLRKQAESMKRQHQAEIDALRVQLTANQQYANKPSTEGFQYDENSNQTWDQQLRHFVEHTVTSMSHRQNQEAQQLRDIQIQTEFESKFRDDVVRFNDFEEVIASVGAPITDPMIYATRGMNNPAAFLYAASKRAPQELQRISKINDPYVQVAEIGKLEASLRQTKPATKAPRPLGRSQDDSGEFFKAKVKKEPTIEERIAEADAKKRDRMNQRKR